MSGTFWRSKKENNKKKFRPFFNSLIFLPRSISRGTQNEFAIIPHAGSQKVNFKRQRHGIVAKEERERNHENVKDNEMLMSLVNPFCFL